jgi:hypothetical protein
MKLDNSAFSTFGAVFRLLKTHTRSDVARVGDEKRDLRSAIRPSESSSPNDQLPEVPPKKVRYSGSEWTYLRDRVFSEARFVYYYVVRRLIDARVSSPISIEEGSADYDIVQFWDSFDIPADVLILMNEWELASKGRYARYNAITAREYISRNFAVEYVLAFDNCWHPAMQSDFFRLCYLYVNGGCYVDADEMPIGPLPAVSLQSGPILYVRPFIRVYDGAEHIDISADEYLKSFSTTEYVEAYFNNAPIIVSKCNPIISLALDHACAVLLSERRFELSLHEITGPTNLSMSIVAHLLDAGTSGKPVSRVVPLDWGQYAHVASPEDLAYKNDARNWRSAERHPGS